MLYSISEWEEIALNFDGGALLMGNGASMSIDGRFGYSSLIDHARENELLTQDVQQLFDFFNREGVSSNIPTFMLYSSNG